MNENKIRCGKISQERIGVRKSEISDVSVRP